MAEASASMQAWYEGAKAERERDRAAQRRELAPLDLASMPADARAMTLDLARESEQDLQARVIEAKREREAARRQALSGRHFMGAAQAELAGQRTPRQRRIVELAGEMDPERVAAVYRALGQ